jgi:hypothetical protein
MTHTFTVFAAPIRDNLRLVQALPECLPGECDERPIWMDRDPMNAASSGRTAWVLLTVFLTLAAASPSAQAGSNRLLATGGVMQLEGSAEFQALLIDEKAVLTDQDRKYVYVLDEHNKAVRKDVVLGRNIDGLRVVQSGLAAQDKVVVHGVQKVFFPGMPVTPSLIEMGAPAPAPQIVAAK